jgi:lysophospholipase L1-like esterase
MISVDLLALLALLALTSATPSPLPVNIGGRVIAVEGEGASFGWPGVYFESRFRGRGVRLRFDAPREHMRLLVDGRERILFRSPGNVDLILDDLPEGDHVVRLEKQTESQSGGGRFLGFFPVGGDKALPIAPRKRQIEFIGDSYTVGYGNSSATQSCTAEEVHDTTDTQAAFGPLVARRFDADYRINAYSGFGMIRNYAGGSRGLSLPAIYSRLKPDDATALDQGRGSWRPQLVVINLGTNDFSTPLKPDEPWRDRPAFEAAYRDAYVGFVRKLHAAQPQARFILMASELFDAQVDQVAASLERDLPGRVTVLRFGGLDHGGCHQHPSLADDRLMAGEIEAKIEGLGIW